MANVNKVIIVGNLGKDPEIKGDIIHRVPKFLERG